MLYNRLETLYVKGMLIMENIIYPIIVVLIIVFIVYKVKRKGSINENVQVNRKDSKTIKLPWVTYIEGLEYLRQGQECNLIVDDEKMTIVADKTKMFNVSLEQIVNAGILRKKEVEMQNKNAIARGLVGGFLTGGIGLFLGGLSGVGQKVKKKSKYYLVINYKTKDSTDIKIMTFGLLVENQRFVKMLNKRLNTGVNVSL